VNQPTPTTTPEPGAAAGAQTAQAQKSPVLLAVVHANGAFSNDDCDRILAIADRQEQRQGSLKRDTINMSIRDSQVSFLDNNAETAWIYERVFKTVDHLNQQYWRFELAGSEPFQIATYTSDGHYKYHLDLGGQPPMNRRKISLSVQLSGPEDYDGGEFETLASHDPVVAPKTKGSFILFPSWVLHRVRPVTRGVRRSLVAWIVGNNPLR